MIIYKAINLINDKIYIGQTTRKLEQRKREHYNYSKRTIQKFNTHFYNAIRKYGWDNFYWEVIDTCETLEKLNELEKYYINYYQSFIPTNGYNQTMGGEGFVLTTESCKKISIAKTGHEVSAETKKKISEAKRGCPAWNKGKKMSEEFCKNNSEAHKGLPSGNKGKTMSEEARKHMSESHLGQIPWCKGKEWSDDQKKSRIEKLGGKSISDYCRKRIDETRKRKKVIRNDGVVFSSIAEAAKATGVSHCSVSNVLNGKIKQACGYTFTL